MAENIQPTVTYEIRVSRGCKGLDPKEPDWEVCEMESGEVKDNADIYDNLTLEEAHQIAEMWSKKRDEASGEV